MAVLLREGKNAHYATGSRAFTETLRRIIGIRGSVQFRYFNSYRDAQANEIDVLICDESHRLRRESANRFTPKRERSGTPQIEELLRASKVAVFLIDDRQPGRSAIAEVYPRLWSASFAPQDRPESRDRNTQQGNRNSYASP